MVGEVPSQEPAGTPTPVTGVAILTRSEDRVQPRSRVRVERPGRVVAILTRSEDRVQRRP